MSEIAAMRSVAPLQIGGALSRAFGAYARGFSKFAIIVGLILAPIFLLRLVVGGAAVGYPAPRGAANPLIWLGIVSFPFGIFAHAACFYGAMQSLRGESFTIAQSVQAAVRRFWPIMGVGVAYGAIVFAGMLLLIVPGLIGATVLYVASPACLIEGLGVSESLKRSRELTRGNRWRIFALFLLLSVFGALGGFAMVLARTGIPSPILQLFLFGWQIVAASFGAVLVTVVLDDLRIAKEGVGADRLSQVFE